ncbi:Ger(x)C family spore germination protein [Cohnella silvisoli]|uniref:Ger(X)C family spore germination protein n=1 Tax=Cohnella silvisoli TaxID=2873699 RepID=A0ABV1L118_9BACL|nr:Ger(x)C family spore germination protein [Cohnella silvisoli]MCD9025350.1 Ger(x)C family spore germination protein [Cohnella silvisoli]
MKQWKLCCTMLILAAFLTNCSDRLNVEDVTFSLLIGIDLDEEDNLLFSISSPVFSKEAKKKEEDLEVRTNTTRKSREEFDRSVVALTMGGKVQAVLLGKRLLQHKGWFQLLDPLYRDNKNTVLPIVALVNGKVSDIIRYSPQDKPRLPIYLAELLRTAHMRNITVNTTIQLLHRQMFEKGMTPSISDLRKDGNLKVMGTALLKEDGRYALTLDPVENKLFSILNPRRGGEFPFTVTIPSQSDESFFKHDKLSFTATDISTKTKVNYEQNNFRFDINVKMRINLSERLFAFNVEKEAKKLEKEIEQQLEAQFVQLIDKIQAAKIDPVGFGLYARAKQYRQWKGVQDRWGEAFSKADVNVKVKVRVMSMGATK